MPRGYPKAPPVVVERALVASERLPSLHEVAALIYAARVGKSVMSTPAQYAVEAYQLAAVFVEERKCLPGFVRRLGE